MSDKDKTTIITIAIAPLSGGKRKVVISGAPELEMPIVKVGTFADLHRLLDEVWVALLKRQPQVVKVKTGSAKPTKESGEDDKETGRQGDTENDGDTKAETANE
jgi:hypothetical protein